MEKFRNPSEDDIKVLLERVHTIAVVGLSPQPNRPSYRVASNLQRFGYRIIPVRPAVAAVLGEKAYARLAAVPEKIDMVDVFRAPAHVDAIVDERIALGTKALWLQDGVVNEPAALRAQAAGMMVVMDRCAYRDYVHFFGHVPHQRPSV
jgi:predicted CoA-binding protein